MKIYLRHLLFTLECHNIDIEVNINPELLKPFQIK